MQVGIQLKISMHGCFVLSLKSLISSLYSLFNANKDLHLLANAETFLWPVKEGSEDFSGCKTTVFLWAGSTAFKK